MRVATQIILQLSLLAAVQPVSAQSPIAQLPDGPTSGLSVERFQYEDEGAIAAVSFHRSRLRHNGFGSEFGVAVFPQYLQFPSLVTAPDAGVAFNISVPAATLLLRGGLGALLGIGGGLSLFPGAHLGGSALVHLDQRLAVRADVLKRWYRIGDETAPFWSMGVGFTVLHE
ncbi:MAG: hypothetical protein ACJ8DC_04310 [Gemmatimonadales bacterium]